MLSADVAGGLDYFVPASLDGIAAIEMDGPVSPDTISDSSGGPTPNHTTTEVLALIHSKDNFINSLLEGVSAAEMQARVQLDFVNTKEILVIDEFTLVEITLISETDPLDAVASLSTLPYVIWAEPNHIYQFDPREFTPNDPMYANQYYHLLMQSNQAWDTTTGTPNIVVAVTDDGVDIDHEDLASNIWVNPGEIAGNGLDDDANGYVDDVNGWDFMMQDNDPNPEAETSYAHGTHVAGIVAAQINNNRGGAGTAGNVTIMPLRWYGSNVPWTSRMIAEAFVYAVNNGAQIINTSYNMDSWVGDPTVTTAWQYVYDQGVLHFNSAGNDNALNPARQAFGQTLLVANTNALDQKAGTSNYGRGIDISAPGELIISTIPNDAYFEISGASLAAPNAAAVAALIWSAHPSWTRDQVAAQLLGTVDKIDALNPNFQGLLGAGRVNAFQALNQRIAPPIITDVIGLPLNNATIHNPLTTLIVDLGSVLDPSSINAILNWELRGNGADDQFGTADDVLIALINNTQYMIGTNELTFTVTGNMPYDEYRFTAFSGGLVDPFGTALDGNGDQVAGDDYVRRFAYRPQTDPTELFEGNGDAFDLDNKALLFTPNARSTDYQVTAEDITALPTSPGGPGLALGDDDSRLVHVTGGQSVKIYGQSFSQFYVGSNGSITFTQGDTRYQESLANHFQSLKISALFDDLNPSSAGNIITEQFSDRVVVSWMNVPQYSSSDSNTFQVEMYFDGRIRMAWLGIDAQDALVGLSDGLGVPADFVETNFSEMGVSSPPSVDVFEVKDPSETTGGYTNQRQVDVTLSTSDNDGTVVGWMITESSTAPSVNLPDWLSIIPTRYAITRSGDGVKTLYAWALADDGQVSTAAQTRITLDTTAPVVTMHTTSTSDSTPDLSGTINDVTANLTVTVNGQTYTATNNGNGTWSFDGSTITPPLGIGIYDVALTATDLAGNTTSDSSNNELTIQADIPTARLNAPNVTTDGANTYTFTVTYQSSVGIDITGLDNQDIRVTGPNGFDQAAQFISVNTPSNGTPRIATYRISAWGGAWDVADNGSYTVTLQANQVHNISTPAVAVVADSLGQFTVDIPDGPILPAVELFEGNDDAFDLDNKALLFTPNTHGTDYHITAEDITVLLAGNGTRLTLGDDDSQLVHITGGQSVKIYGQSFSQFYVGSNGYITFTQGDTGYQESLANHFQGLKISALFDDLNPSSAGSIITEQFSDRAVVTWMNVPQYGSSDSNTFQVEMYFDGRIRIAWLGVASTDALVGLSDGQGVSPDFTEADLSAMDTRAPESSIESETQWEMSDLYVSMAANANDDGILRRIGDVSTFTNQVNFNQGHQIPARMPALPRLSPIISTPVNLGGQIVYLDSSGVNDISVIIPIASIDRAPSLDAQGLVSDTRVGLGYMFARIGINVVTGRPTEGLHRMIYISTMDLFPWYLDLAEAIGEENLDTADIALVSVDRFELTVENLALVITPELRHLLGYSH